MDRRHTSIKYLKDNFFFMFQSSWTTSKISHLGIKSYNLKSFTRYGIGKRNEKILFCKYTKVQRSIHSISISYRYCMCNGLTNAYCKVIEENMQTQWKFLWFFSPIILFYFSYIIVSKSSVSKWSCYLTIDSEIKSTQSTDLAMHAKTYMQFKEYNMLYSTQRMNERPSE